MNTRPIKYIKGLKYQTTQVVYYDTKCYPKEDVHTKWLTLYTDGMMIIAAGYAWDGPSGPTLDTHTFMRGSLIHDALYELMRKGYLDRSFKKQADIHLRDICFEDNMFIIRIWWVYRGILNFGRGATLERNIKKVYEAPRQWKIKDRMMKSLNKYLKR